jgi:hypothetical protein
VCSVKTACSEPATLAPMLGPAVVLSSPSVSYWAVSSRFASRARKF